MHAKAQGYTTILRLGARGVDYAKYVIMQTAIKGLQNTAQLQAVQPLLTDASSRTVVDGPAADYSNGHAAHRSNGYSGFVEASHVDHLDTFQYSDDDDADYLPPAAVKEEIEESQDEPVEEQVARTRPKRRSARSRKQTKTAQMYEDVDFED